MQINQIQNVCERGLHYGQAGTGFSCVRNIFSYYHHAAKNYYLIQETIFGKNKMVARDFICQASEFDKLLGADPQEAQGGHRLLDLRRSVVNTIY